MYEYVLDPKPEGDEEPEEVFESVVSEYDSRVEDLHLKKEMKKKREREAKRKKKREMNKNRGMNKRGLTKAEFNELNNLMHSIEQFECFSFADFKREIFLRNNATDAQILKVLFWRE